MDWSWTGLGYVSHLGGHLRAKWHLTGSGTAVVSHWPVVNDARVMTFVYHRQPLFWPRDGTRVQGYPGTRAGYWVFLYPATRVPANPCTRVAGYGYVPGYRRVQAGTRTTRVLPVPGSGYRPGYCAC